MAIDDNTSYELTGAQVKDIVNNIKAKAADNVFVGATSALPGAKGLIPAPQAGDDTKFLSGDGTWQTINVNKPNPRVYSYYEASGLSNTKGIWDASVNDTFKLFVDDGQGAGTPVSTDDLYDMFSTGGPVQIYGIYDPVSYLGDTPAVVTTLVYACDDEANLGSGGIAPTYSFWVLIKDMNEQTMLRVFEGDKQFGGMKIYSFTLAKEIPLETGGGGSDITLLYATDRSMYMQGHNSAFTQQGFPYRLVLFPKKPQSGTTNKILTASDLNAIYEVSSKIMVSCDFQNESAYNQGSTVYGEIIGWARGVNNSGEGFLFLYPGGQANIRRVRRNYIESGTNAVLWELLNAQ